MSKKNCSPQPGGGADLRAAEMPELPGIVEWWLSQDAPEMLIYHRGNLARDRQHCPRLEQTATVLQHLSDRDWTVISKCGHERAVIRGQGRVRLTQARDLDGSTAYIAIKAPKCNGG